MKYLLILFVLVLIGLAISFAQADLPHNQKYDWTTDFIALTQPPTEVSFLLQGHCYNCHSARAPFPKIAHFAPFDKRYAEPVRQGREKLNFSKWTSYTEEMQKVLLLIAVEQMENHVMPLQHIFPSVDTLTQEKMKLLSHWLAQEGEAGM